MKLIDKIKAFFSRKKEPTWDPLFPPIDDDANIDWKMEDTTKYKWGTVHSKREEKVEWRKGPPFTVWDVLVHGTKWEGTAYSKLDKEGYKKLGITMGHAHSCAKCWEEESVRVKLEMAKPKAKQKYPFFYNSSSFTCYLDDEKSPSPHFCSKHKKVKE